MNLPLTRTCPIPPIAKSFSATTSSGTELRAEAADISQQNIVFRIFHVIYLPIRLTQDLTIPATTDEKWSKSWAIFYPFTVSIFLIWQFGFFVDVFTSVLGVAVWFILSSILSAMIWKLTFNNNLPKGLVKLPYYCDWLSSQPHCGSTSSQK